MIMTWTDLRRILIATSCDVPVGHKQIYDWVGCIGIFNICVGHVSSLVVKEISDEIRREVIVTLKMAIAGLAKAFGLINLSPEPEITYFNPDTTA